MLKGNQQLMEGMQVHYRGAGAVDPEYGPNKTWPTFIIRKGKLVTGPDGKPLRKDIAPNDPNRKKIIAEFVKANGGGSAFTCQTQMPEGIGDVTSRAVFGNRHESDCEGMASFRLRTLPPDFKTLGVVSGRLRTGRGIGHVVAVFQAPDGRVFVSSNGKPLIEVKASAKKVTGDDIRAAVVQEFDDIYRDSQTEGDFFLGIGKATPPADDSLEARNNATNQVLQEASTDDILRSNRSTQRSMPALDWNQLAP
jgi:hypothetical protein